MAMVLAGAAVGSAQHSHGGDGHRSGPPLHVSQRWKDCSFQLHSSLTQSAWRQFAGEAGVVTWFRPLVDAAPMGRGRWELSALQWKTGIDDATAAWNDTFVHPDSSHWLFEGSGLQFPGLSARVGVTDRTDVGLYVTKNFSANYGVYGIQVQHGLLNDARGWSVATRATLVSLFGPEDVNFKAYGAEFVASRRIALFSGRVSFSPYVGMSALLSTAHEKSAVVALDDEQVVGGQASLGAVVQLWGIRLAMEATAARVPNVALKIGFGRGGR